MVGSSYLWGGDLRGLEGGMLDRSRDLGADAVLIILHAEVREKRITQKAALTA